MLRFTINQQKILVLLVIIIVGILLRVYQFTDIPPSLHQDEASAGYEAYSLLLTGKDRWGNSWLSYFPSWSTGQNVLYSYLSIPIIKFFGLNPLTTRLVSLIFGILTLPLLYLTIEPIFDLRTNSRSLYSYIISF